MPYCITSGFEGGERSLIFAVRGIDQRFALVEEGERTFSLPFQKDRTDRVSLDHLKGLFGCGSIAATSCNLALNQRGIELIQMILVLSRHIHGFLRVSFRARQIVCLQS